MNSYLSIILRGGIPIEKVIFIQSVEMKSLYIARMTVSGWLAYIYPGDEPTRPSTLSLKKTWEQNHGIYIFAPFAPISIRDVVKKVNDFLDDVRDPNATKSTFIWLGNPNAERFSRENAWFLSIKKTPTQIYIADNDFYVPFGEYISFSIPRGCLVKYDDNAQHFRIRENNSQGLPIVFSGSASQTDTKILNHEVYLPFIGQSCGTFRFQMTARDNDFYDNFNIGMRYYFPNNNDTTMMNFPLFQTSESETRTFTFQVGLDPVDQWNAHSLTKNKYRTYLAFEQNNPEIPSYYRTHFGHEIYLIPTVYYEYSETNLPYKDPQEKCAKYLFTPQRKNFVSKDYPMYMLPHGLFRIKVPKVKSNSLVPIQILCGLVGTETISCVPNSENFEGDALYFETGKAAYAPVFPLTDENRHIINPELLIDDYLTAWVSVCRLNSDNVLTLPIRYLSQPEEESLFSQVDNPKILDYFQSPVADMTNLITFIPLVPHSGVNFNHSLQNVRIELEIISAVRKQLMDKLFYLQVNSSNLKDDDEKFTEQVKVTTPQGLLLTLNNNSWEELLIAQNKEASGSSDLKSLKFESVTQHLRNALQTNQQFLVITDNTNIEKFKNKIPIAGWPFHINIGSTINNPSNEFRNVLIFKFCKGSLFDYVKNPKLWTNPENFNNPTQLTRLSNWLQDYCQHAIDDAKLDNENLKTFSDLIQNANWNGIIALKVDMSLAEFPDELACLLGGIEDKENLFAHHIGINMNRVESNSSGLKMDKVSSLFGFIYYKDDNNNQGCGVSNDYEFKVKKLEVLFKNSKLVSFSGNLKLWMCSLFGSEVIGNNELTFEGTYEDHNGVPSYVFNTIDVVNLKLKNSILQSLLLYKASFRTMKVIRNERGEIKEVYTRFSFWGRLNFVKQIPDLFSYGSESGVAELEQGAGLAFSNLGINMDFPLNTQGLLKLLNDKIFTFDVSELSIDVANSIQRTKSLVTGMPLQLSRFIVDKGKNELEKEGYIPIKSISRTGNFIDRNDLQEKWYGFDFTLDFGNKGALNSNNSLTVSLALCWSSNSNTYIGVKIPGISQQSTLFKLQEIIDTSFSNIELIFNQEGDYVLALRNFSQFFLGNGIFPEGCDTIYLFKNPSATTGSLGWYAAVAEGTNCGERGVNSNEKEI
ncbi:hypothetical protein [Bacillus cereus]|uniref:hypothetical protein n=1 Tax=Bacillus cereus TaxID=1396 RepID=UPI000BF5F0C4|nr:hypothetical protein [Bacillus cereus]PET19469.1 hypothetical protein CN519_29345 [Bacillus cereus]PEU36432.1 hypothetical protein CN387_23890 [Bacillus cereus]PEY73875.1 hypothetical protein CN344_27215 [Bacillus cereus]PFI11183.1 hypothetical protein COI71_29430 [Bacillus cereus]PFS86307.1 hypothetical protein COK54_27480 [Bacillus cereus]